MTTRLSCIQPTEQLYQTPGMLGAEVTLWKLDPSRGWGLDLVFLRWSIRENTKMIVLNSPNKTVKNAVSSCSKSMVSCCVLLVYVLGMRPVEISRGMFVCGCCHWHSRNGGCVEGNAEVHEPISGLFRWPSRLDHVLWFYSYCFEYDHNHSATWKHLHLCICQGRCRSTIRDNAITFTRQG